MSIVDLAINGASGRMGRALTTLVRGDRRFALKRVVTGADSELIGQPLYVPATPDTLRYATSWEGSEALDVIVDFSSPEGLAVALEHCVAHGIALVVGTTGMDADLEAKLQSAADDIAILRAANFSLGVAVLTRLLREAAAALPAWDLEIIEAHHGRKQDAPSGTALALGQAAAAARGSDLDAVAEYGRHGHTGERSEGSIGFSVVRGGDIVGEHTALIASHGERLELTHRATDRDIFARGALTAAAWLARQKPGTYTIDQVLDDRSS
ncbi:MAG TPA: 4-hydroxy-tetrahydrodipicolinate reductase [Oleiagrimonas sp.]|nr:4-hydroxy-tetrahydrodipicolinate reductase [Oleiagrimonas sp.]